MATDFSGDRHPFSIVGIGASAGGLEALEAFFSQLTTNLNATFVIVQHLSPDFPSLLVELLQQRTPLPVHPIEDAMMLQPNRVFVLPPGYLLHLAGATLRLTTPPQRFNHTIDQFFESLAQTWGDRAIGILLSGTGSDGTAGLEAIQRAGGLALVQSLNTAQFTSMPSGPIERGVVDEILSPSDLAATVESLVRFAGEAVIHTAAGEQPLAPDHLQQIFDLLSEHEQVDFSQYRVSTLRRRITHRLALIHCASLDQYIRRLETSAAERHALRQDLLIGATSFFRDPLAWEILETQVLPRLIDALLPDQQLRVWVTACATGEEAYSMAIAVDEAIARSGKPIQAKIFATDIDRHALEAVSAGVYSSQIAQQMSPDRLKRYFTCEEGTYRVKRSLRQMLIVGFHDLAQDAAFSNMHLVSCRNVMIYMQPALQSRVIRLLNFALVPGGVLFLGSAETLRDFASDFTTVDFHWKLFEKQHTLIPSLVLPNHPMAIAPSASPQLAVSPSRMERLLGDVFQFCLGDRAITCLLTDENHQLLHVLHDANRILEIPVGEIDLNVTRIVPPDLRLPLGMALHRAQRDRQAVLYSGIPGGQDENAATFTLRVGIHSTAAAGDDYWIIVLEREQGGQAIAPTPAFEVSMEAALQITELEYELQQTRANLRVAIQELENTSEELQGTNEELLAANEELQSTNEELRSSNEELYTINAEYQRKIDELTQLTDDMDNLLRSTHIGVVFLDRQLHLRKFTPLACNVFNIRPSDIDRPLAHFTHNLDCADLFQRLQQVLDTQSSLEQEVRLLSNSDHLLMGIHPYFKDHGEFDGIVLTFVGINDLKQTQAQFQRRTDELERLYETVPVGLGVVDAAYRVVRSNQVLAEIDGYASVADHVGTSLLELDIAEYVLPTYQQVLETGEPILNREIRAPRPNQPEVEGIWLSSYYPIERVNGERAVGVTVVDITAVKQTELELHRSRQLREAIFSESTDAIFLVDAATRLTFDCNPRAVELFEGDRKEALLQLDVNLLRREPLPPDELASLQAEIDEHGFWEGEVEYVTWQGHAFWGQLATKHIQVAGQRINLVRITDITARKRAEQILNDYYQALEAEISSRTTALRESEARFRAIAENLPGAVFQYVLRSDGSDQVIYTSQGCYDLWEIEAEVVQTNAQGLWEVIHPDDVQAMYESVLESARTLQPWLWEWRITTPSGKQKWLQGAGKPVRRENGDVVWDTVILDVSDRHRTEAALRETTARLERAQQIAHLGSWERDFVADTLVWSQETLDIFGLPPDAAVTFDSFMACVHPDDVERLRQAQNDALARGPALDIEYRIVRANGDIRFLHEQGEAVFDGDGRRLRISGTVLDITERKRAELALQESEQFLRSIYDFSHNAIFVVDVTEDGDFRYVGLNRSHETSTGLSSDAIRGKTPEEVVSPEFAATVRENYQRCVDTGTVVTYEEYLPFHGENFWWLTSLSPVRDSSGRICRLIGTSSNITDRKRTEQALRESEAQLREAQRVAQIGTWEFDVVTQQINWSIEIFHIFGRDRQQGVPSFEELRQLVHPEDRDDWQANLERAIATGNLGSHDSLRILHPNGDVRYVEIKGETIIDAQGQVVQMFGTILDVTDRKQAELALQEQEAFFRSLFDRAPMGIALCTLAGEIVRVNRTYCEILGYSEADLLGCHMEVAEQTDQQTYRRVFDQIAAGESDYFSGEHRFIRQDNSVIWVRITASVVRDEAGTPLTIMAIVEDINQRKQAARALQLSEAQFRTIFEHSAIGITVVFPPDYKLGITNAALQEMLGYTAAELQEMDHTHITLADDLPLENQFIEECLTGDRNTYQLEKRYVRQDGRVFWGNLITSIIRDAEGEIQSAIAMVEDITERKRAVDLEISRNRDLREAIFEESTDALFLVDRTTNLTVDCNQRAVELFEADSKEELLHIQGMTLQRQPFPPEEQAAILTEFEQNGVWVGELEYRTLKGNAFWGRMAVKRLYIAEMEMGLVQVADVSDRKQIELDIRRNVEELQRLNQTKDDFLSTVSHELRTPLTSIDMAGRMLRIALEQQNLLVAGDDPSTNKFLRYLRILQDQTQQEGELINDLLDLQRLNADAFALDLVDIDLPGWLTPIVDSIRERAAQEQQQFEVAIPPHIHPFRTDPAVLRRILSELLNNACKYTPPQERIHFQVASIPATSPASTDVLQVQILNTGVEISPEDRERVFEPFYRAVKGDRWSKRGTGLGLSLVRKFVDCLGGTIRVSSAANQTCFTVELPFQDSLWSNQSNSIAGR